ncbi:molybdate transport system regulatory protein [Halanaerobium saccharolyticum]|uniref:Molybdate transport system regulatory protein n=1 Tax=Halanaerobium saccharolyticum TaxID=43595 RepID=A0A4R7ZEX1_9FIRM|nr:LysR family transcriptional regulator [Halanaerobium saccharolyticum]RAK11844.1 molybdate transport system regulatory protein [Halanaerobium saccharolyticum]TDW07685.1 molybdate transport system regulatory protein [Halanaerobium saccharolyticum]TDX64606.1 molybdate transport system regulatory protein [Halanaerobium saccharolyticum]
MRLNYKLWLEEDERIFGDGPCQILELIDQLGSLRQAAAKINMSYSQAWKLIRKLEKRLGFKLLDKKVGGSSGGGSELTVKGRILTKKFSAFRKEASQSLSELEEKYFNQEFKQRLK